MTTLIRNITAGLVIAPLAATLTSAQGLFDDPFAEPDKVAAPMPAPKPANILVSVHCYEVSTTDYLKLIKINNGTTDFSELQKKLDQMQDSKQAELVEATTSVSQPGIQTSLNSIKEYIYPTDYDSSGVVAVTGGKDDGIRTSVIERQHICPTAFEMRNTGTGHNIEASIIPRTHDINVEISYSMVEVVQPNKYAVAIEDNHQKNIFMPKFYIRKISTGYVAKNGKPFLLGVTTPKDKHGVPDTSKKIFVMSTVETIK